MDDKKVAQVTVEDPNESFDDLRDRQELNLFIFRSDLKVLISNNILQGKSAPISKDVLHKISRDFKLSKVI